MNRQSLLSPARYPTHKNDNETFLVTTYNPSNPSLKNILDRNKLILESSTQYGNISPKLKWDMDLGKIKISKTTISKQKFLKPGKQFKGTHTITPLEFNTAIIKDVDTALN